MIDILQESVELVKGWGNSKLANGKTLSEFLSIDGVSLWDVASVDMAFYRVPEIISRNNGTPSLWKTIKPYLIRAKRKIIDFATVERSNDGCFLWPKERTVLLLGFSGYMYREVLEPVAIRLAKEKSITPLVINDWRNSKNYYDINSGIIYQSIWQHWDDVIEAQTRINGKKLECLADELLKGDMLSRLITRDDDCFWPQMKGFFGWFLKTYLPSLVSWLTIASHMFEEHDIDLVVSPDPADPRTRLFCIAGNNKKIPVQEIQFGLCGKDSMEWRFSVGDHVAAWGEESRNMMLQHGVSPDKVFVTGSPRHDVFFNKDTGALCDLKNKIGLPMGDKVVLLISTYCIDGYNGLENQNLITIMKEAVFQAVGSVEGLTLIVKPHPLEKVSRTKRLAKGCKNIIFLDPSCDARELIKISDAVVAFGSSLTMDSLVANKLTICPAFPGWALSDVFVNSGATLVPASKEDIFCIFKNISTSSEVYDSWLSRSSRQTFLDRCVYKVDGQSCSRVVIPILDMSIKI